MEDIALFDLMHLTFSPESRALLVRTGDSQLRQMECFKRHFYHPQ
jgi:hypothetical protein